MKHENNWIAQQDDFNAILADLNKAQQQESEATKAQNNSAHVQKLEERSQNSRARVHYRKSTKGKDLSSKTSKDLDCIFGRRSNVQNTSTSQCEATPVANLSEKSEDARAEFSAKCSEHGVVTISTGLSVQEYFAQKMAALKQKRLLAENNATQEENEKSVCEPEPQNSEKNAQESESKKSKKEKRKESKKRKLEASEDDEESTPRKKKSKKSKKKSKKSKKAKPDINSNSSGKS